MRTRTPCEIVVVAPVKVSVACTSTAHIVSSGEICITALKPAAGAAQRHDLFGDRGEVRVSGRAGGARLVLGVDRGGLALGGILLGPVWAAGLRWARGVHRDSGGGERGDEYRALAHHRDHLIHTTTS